MDIIEALGLPTEYREEIISAVAGHFRNQNKAALQKKGVTNPAEISLADDVLVTEGIKQLVVSIWKKDVQRKKQHLAAQEGSDEVDRKVAAAKKPE